MRLILLRLCLSACGTDQVGVVIDPAADSGSWTAKSPMPTPRQEMTSAHIAGHIYIPGGYDASRNASALLEVYSVASDA